MFPFLLWPIPILTTLRNTKGLFYKRHGWPRINALRFAERGPKLVKQKHLSRTFAHVVKCISLFGKIPAYPYQSLHAFAVTLVPIDISCDFLRHMIRTWKIRPGDLVYVISGNDKNNSGEVLMVDPRRNMLKVKGMNKRKAGCICIMHFKGWPWEENMV